MKLVAMMFAAVLAMPAAAHAEGPVLTPPGGPVYVQEPVKHKARALRRALMAHFDLDRDGRLDPRERRRAIRILRRIEMKLAGRAAQRGARRQRR